MNGWKSIAGNTTNMRQHLRNKHPGLFDELVELCQQQKNRYNPENWAIVPYVPKEEIFENILLRSGSVDDDEVDADEEYELDPSPLQTDSTQSASPKEEIFENILLRSGSVNDDEVDADEDCDLDPSPLQADSTPSASVSNNELSTFEPEAARNDVLPSKSFQEEEAALRLELLRNQIRREKAMAEFYEIQTKEIQQRLVSNLQRPASQF
uniref:BED-type domain-containing protein n=1 Tax=Panagrolaimus sp. JU765 TaxID=591449 RepID=A0AC34QEG9_9BILA